MKERAKVYIHDPLDLLDVEAEIDDIYDNGRKPRHPADGEVKAESPRRGRPLKNREYADAEE
jgi:hypothetical protein